MNAIEHRFEVIPDNEAGGYVIVFPSLRGCMTQVEELSEIPAMAEDVYRLWIRTCEEDGLEIAPIEQPVVGSPWKDREG